MSVELPNESQLLEKSSAEYKRLEPVVLSIKHCIESGKELPAHVRPASHEPDVSVFIVEEADRKYVVKFVVDRLMLGEGFDTARELFDTEKKALLRANGVHNVYQLIGDSENEKVLITSFVPGEPLTKFEGRVVTPEQDITPLKDLAATIATLYEKGVVPDPTPTNALYDAATKKIGLVDLWPRSTDPADISGNLKMVFGVMKAATALYCFGRGNDTFQAPDAAVELKEQVSNIFRNGCGGTALLRDLQTEGLV